jgi:5-methylcytosine-specific restriction protein A
MAFNPNLNYGDEINNNQIREIFNCGLQGGMRKSNSNNLLVLISDQTKPYYKDKWEGDILKYTGMGIKGDQDINFMQNKTLAKSDENGVDVFLFEVTKPKVYTYRGRVRLAAKPYTANQKDKDGNDREVWIFPLKIVSETPLITEKEFIQKQEQEEKKASSLPFEELKRRAQNAVKNKATKEATTKVYPRDPNVAAYAKKRANGFCQLCDNTAPFNSKDNIPYLEVHHIIWLSQSGEDSINNTVALCPNCHRKMHILNLESDKLNLKNKNTGQ